MHIFIFKNATHETIFPQNSRWSHTCFIHLKSWNVENGKPICEIQTLEAFLNTLLKVWQNLANNTL